jgi:hypothetical protein
MEGQNPTRPVRFRAVIEMSFPDADPWDPQDYGKLIAQWKHAMENNPIFSCRDVAIKEILTIGNIDDYEDWRAQKGEYERSPNPNIKGVTYPVPKVNPDDLARVWEAMSGQQSAPIDIEGVCEAGANVEALMARSVFLLVLRDEGHLPDWESDQAKADAIFKHAATFPLDRPDQKTAVVFISTLPVV